MTPKVLHYKKALQGFEILLNWLNYMSGSKLAVYYMDEIDPLILQEFGDGRSCKVLPLKDTPDYWVIDYFREKIGETFVIDHYLMDCVMVYVDDNYLYMFVTYGKSTLNRIGILCYKYDRKHGKSICLCNEGCIWNVLAARNVFEAALRYLYDTFRFELRGDCVRDFYASTLQRLHRLKL